MKTWGILVGLITLAVIAGAPGCGSKSSSNNSNNTNNNGGNNNGSGTQKISNYTVGSRPVGIAIDASGDIWVADSGGSTVSEIITSTSKTVSITVAAPPWGIAIDQDGNVWVSEPSAGNIQEISGTTAQPAQNIGGSPYGIAVDSQGVIWCTDTKNNQIWDSNDGTWTAGAGTAVAGRIIDQGGQNIWYDAVSSGKGELYTTLATQTPLLTNSPTGMGVDQNGNLWVADSTGYVESVVGSGYDVHVGGKPMGIAVDQGYNAWVADNTGNVVEINQLLAVANSYHVGGSPEGIAIDSNGNVWVTNSGGNTVTRLAGVAPDGPYWPYSGAGYAVFPGGGNW